ncbi:MAG: methyltransferase domain-containing protein [Rubripirellula sp.]
MIKRELPPGGAGQCGRSDREYLQASAGLAKLNQFTGVAAAMYRHLRINARARKSSPMRVLDLASGAGDVPIAWARRARREGLRLQITTLDLSSSAIEEQQRRASDAGVTIKSLQMDCLSGPLPCGFDFVTCSMLMHRLEQRQAVRLLQSMQATSEDGILVCDFDRSRLNLCLVSTGVHLLSRSPVVHEDIAARVRSSFTADEFKNVAESSLGRPVRVRRVLPCHFLVTLEARSVPETTVAFA